MAKKKGRGWETESEILDVSKDFIWTEFFQLFGLFRGFYLDRNFPAFFFFYCPTFAFPLFLFSTSPPTREKEAMKSLFIYLLSGWLTFLTLYQSSVWISASLFLSLYSVKGKLRVRERWGQEPYTFSLMSVSWSDKWSLWGKHGQKQQQPSYERSFSCNQREHRQELPTGRVWGSGVETDLLGRAFLGRDPEALRKLDDVHPECPCAIHETWGIKEAKAHHSEENPRMPPPCLFWPR